MSELLSFLLCRFMSRWPLILSQVSKAEDDLQYRYVGLVTVEIQLLKRRRLTDTKGHSARKSTTG